METRILQRIADENPLQSLTPEDRQEHVLPVTRDPRPKACSAWVRFGPHARQVDAVVVVWNDVARYTVHHRRQGAALLGPGQQRHGPRLSERLPQGQWGVMIRRA